MMNQHISNSEERLPGSSRYPDSSVETRNSYDYLCQKFWIPCEFCDKLFPDRLSSIKHNAAHIIIPLIKLTVHQCTECLFHFTSTVDLNSHITNKHRKSQNNHKIPDHEILKSMIQKQVVVKCEDNIRELNKLNGTINRNVEIKNDTKLDLDHSMKANKLEYEDKHILLDTVYISSDEESVIEKKSPKSSPNSKLSIQMALMGPNHLNINNSQSVKSELDIVEEHSPETKIYNRDLNISFKEDSLYNISSEECKPPERHDSLFGSSPNGVNNPGSRPNSTMTFSWIFDEFPVTKLDHVPEVKIASTNETSIVSSQMDPGIGIKQENDLIDYEPMRCRLKFEDDDDLFEPEEILPDKPCCPRKVKPQDTSEPHIQFQNTMNSQIHTANSQIQPGSSRILTLNSQIQIANSQIQPGSSLILTLNSQIQTANSLIQPGNSLIQKPADTGSKPVALNKPVYAPSVHFDDLMQAIKSKCRFCNEIFPNRIELIKHEATHLSLRNRRGPSSILCCICDRHLAGNYVTLRRHTATKHPEHDDRKLSVKKCDVCHLAYHNYFRHARNYHQLYKCPNCSKYFDKEHINCHFCTDMPVILSEKPKPDEIDVVNMCEICLVCARRRHSKFCRVTYEVISEQCVLGTKQKCGECQNEFFSVNVVKRTYIYREEPCKESLERLSATIRRRKPLSNKDRLTSIQKRLKMIKNRIRF